MADLTLRWFVEGVLSTRGTGSEVGGVYRTDDDDDYVLTSVFTRCKSAPSGAPIVIDINDDGESLFTYNPQLSAVNEHVWDTVKDTVVRGGSIISLDIDSISSTIPGEDLTVIANFDKVN